MIYIFSSSKAHGDGTTFQVLRNVDELPDHFYPNGFYCYEERDAGYCSVYMLSADDLDISQADLPTTRKKEEYEEKSVQVAEQQPWNEEFKEEALLDLVV